MGILRVVIPAWTLGLVGALSCGVVGSGGDEWADYGEPCAFGDDCSSGICFNDRCSQACTTSCPNGDRCEDVFGDQLCNPTSGGSGSGSGSGSACTTSTDCLNCTARDGCGFCSSNQSCQAGTASGPSSGSCANWDWEPNQCTSGGTFKASCSCDSHPMMNHACVTNATINVCGSFSCFEEAQLNQPAGSGFCTATCSSSQVGQPCSGGGVCTRFENPNLSSNPWHVCY